MNFPNIFEKFARILTGHILNTVSILNLVSFHIFLTYREVISVCLRFSGNINNCMELIKLLQSKLLKMLVFSFTTFIVISKLFDSLFSSSFKMSFQIFFDQPQQNLICPCLYIFLNCISA